MPTRPQIELTKEELERAEIPLNHVLIRIDRRAEGLKTNAGIVIGYNEDTVYAEGDDSHSANLAENIGYVTKVPKALYFNPDDPKSMDWDTDMELQVGDQVWFSLIEAKNSVQLICEDVLYKSCPYQDIYVAKRKHWALNSSKIPEHISPQDFIDEYKRTGQVVFNQKEGNPITELTPMVIPLNGFVLCEPCFRTKLSDLDHFSTDVIDKTRGVVKFLGRQVKGYLRAEYTHIEDLRVGDEVLFDPKTPLFYLERLGMTSIFDNGKQYWVVPRRRISMVLKRESDEDKSNIQGG